MSNNGLIEALQKFSSVVNEHSPHPDRVKLVAVSKKFDANLVRSANASGLVDFGENYAQELAAKATELADLAIAWHFIGGLQRNKVKKIARVVSVWHSVDRASLLAEIAKHSPGASVLLQVNTTGEESKSGCAPSQVDELLEQASQVAVNVVGLTTMGPTAQGDPDLSFSELARLAQTFDLPELSMGMSGDYVQALENGATYVRLGTALFGQRPS